MQGEDTDRGGESGNEVVGSEGDRLGETTPRGAETESESEIDMEEEEARSSDSVESGSSGAEWSGASVDQWEVKKTSNILHKERV